MDLFWLRQMRPSGMHQMSIWIGGVDLPAHHVLNTIHLEWWQEFTVGHRLETVFAPAYANKFLHMRIPGGYVIIPDRPGDAITKTFGVDEFIFTPSLTGASPGKRLPTYLVSPYPFERLFLNIRMILVPDKKMRSRFINPVRLADERVVLQILSRHPEPVPEFPRCHIGSGIILDVRHVSASLKDK